MEKQKQIAELLQAISDANEGKLTPEQVVEAAKDPNSPLHDQFLWNDREAAHKHRLNIARQLIRSVKVIRKTSTRVITAPVYVRDPDLEAKQAGYIDVRTIGGDEERERDILIDEFRRVRAVFERSAEIATFFGMQDRLEDMQRQLKTMIAELSGVEGRA